MTTIRYAWAAMLLPLLAPACQDAPRSSAMPAAEGDKAAHDMARIDADVRLEVALKRIAALEREVAELKAGPATVDADMLRQQLSVTENALANASRGGMADDAAPSPSVDATGLPVVPTSPRQRKDRLTQQAGSASPAEAKTAPGQRLELDLH